MGAGHASAAMALAEMEGETAFNGRMSASIWLLVGYALELTLKAAYLHLGGDPDKLQKMGHRLKTVHAAAKAVGFNSEVLNLEWYIEHLHEPHAGHFFRYSGFGQVHLPELEGTVSMLDRHVRQVADLVLQD